MAILSAIARERGRAVLVVTHDPRLFGFADRIMHIEDGSLTADEFTDPDVTCGAALTEPDRVSLLEHTHQT